MEWSQSHYGVRTVELIAVSGSGTVECCPVGVRVYYNSVRCAIPVATDFRLISDATDFGLPRALVLSGTGSSFYSCASLWGGRSRGHCIMLMDVR